MLLEFSQLWQIALVVPIFLYGPIDAIILGGYGIGGGVASRLQLHKPPVMFTALAVMLLSTVGLAYIHNIYVVVVCITLLIILLTSITVVLTKTLHDSLHSKIRAGAASAVSSLGRMIIIPVSLVFGYSSQHYSIFQASWILVGLLVVTICFISIAIRRL